MHTHAARLCDRVPSVVVFGFCVVPVQVMTDPKYAEAARRISVKMQLYYSFRRPVQRAADEVEVMLARPAPRPSATQQNEQPAAGQSGGVVDVGQQSDSSSHKSEL